MFCSFKPHKQSRLKYKCFLQSLVLGTLLICFNNQRILTNLNAWMNQIKAQICSSVNLSRLVKTFSTKLGDSLCFTSSSLVSTSNKSNIPVTQWNQLFRRDNQKAENRLKTESWVRHREVRRKQIRGQNWKMLIKTDPKSKTEQVNGPDVLLELKN